MSDEENCWICGERAESREHRTKRSDLNSLFGVPSQKQPLFFHSNYEANRVVGSLDAAKLKWPTPICSYCNNTRTQPHDMAWTKLSEALRSRQPSISPGTIIRTNRIFSVDSNSAMLNVHLFFVKLFGCYLAEGGFTIPTAEFASAIMNDRACPLLYIKFACASAEEGRMASASDLCIAREAESGTARFAAWIYHVGRLKVLLMYAAPGEQCDGLIGSWHPKMGTNRLVIADLRD